VTALLQESTRHHYDEYPFIEGGQNRITWWRNYLSEFLPDEAVDDRLVLDVGSSIGEISRSIGERNGRMVCLDLSRQSLMRCRQINPEAEIFHGSALELPFADNTFDHVISIGVLHHTPDCRRGFHEVARVAAPGATVVVFLYNYWNIYNVIYHGFWPIRKLIPLSWLPRWMLRTLQPFARAHLGQTLNDAQLRRLMGDKLWTPRATFHSVSEVRRWGQEEGLAFVGNKRFFLGYANVMCFRKEGAGASMRREVALKCTKCGHSPMTHADDIWSCGRCGRDYVLGDGIYECLAE
jgi:SAM-dependent methyltransferase/ribosomal protein S27AE